MKARPAPGLDPARDQGEVLGPTVGLVEQVGLVQEGVRPVEAVAPAVERADEAAPQHVAVALVDDLHTPVATGVVERPDGRLVDAHDDDRLAQDLVGDVVAGVGNLGQVAGHLPDPRPEQLVLHGVELGVVVALAGTRSVRVIGVRHGESRKLEGRPLVLGLRVLRLVEGRHVVLPLSCPAQRGRQAIVSVSNDTEAATICQAAPAAHL